MNTTIVLRERERVRDLVTGVNVNGSNPELEGALPRAELISELIFYTVDIDSKRRQHRMLTRIRCIVCYCCYVFNSVSSLWLINDKPANGMDTTLFLSVTCTTLLAILLFVILKKSGNVVGNITIRWIILSHLTSFFEQTRSSHSIN